jgi:hypothetical protein
MKTIKNVLKGIILTGAIAILTSIPTFASEQPTNQTTPDEQITDYYTLENGDVKTVYADGSYYINSDVEIQSVNYIDKSITVDKQGQLYKFYVDEPREYYLSEIINITMDQNNEIIDCTVDSQPETYNGVISQTAGTIATLKANGQVYIFENTEGIDGWQVGENCKAIIQDGRLIEVRPIPLAERL